MQHVSRGHGLIDVLIRLIGHINCFARAFLDCQLNRSDLLVDGLWHQRVVAAYEREQWTDADLQTERLI